MRIVAGFEEVADVQGLGGVRVSVISSRLLLQTVRVTIEREGVRAEDYSFGY